MARVALSDVVLQEGRPATYGIGVQAYIYKRGTVEQVSLFTKESGGSEVAQPLITDEGGRLRHNGAVVWVAPGSYDLLVSGQTVPVEAASGSASGSGGVTLGEVEALVAAEKVARESADAGKQPLDTDLTAIAALETTAFGRALLALANAAAGRTALGLGTAAVEPAEAFQPKDIDLTALAALNTTSYGRSLLEAANAAALRTLAGLGSAAVEPASAFQAASVTLTSIAALTTTSNGRALLTLTAPNTRIDPYTVNFQPAGAELLGLFPIRVPVGESATLIGMALKTTSGTCKVKVKRTTESGKGSSTEPLKEKEAKTELAEFSPSSETLADKDLLEVFSEGAATGLLMATLYIARVKT